MSIDPRYLPPPPSTSVDNSVDIGSSSTSVDNPVDKRAGDLRGHYVSEFARDRLVMIDSTKSRSRQTTVGPSEIGQDCPRRLAYRIAGTPAVNFPDPLKAMIGTGLHEVIASGLHRLEGGTGRYLIEHSVTYRGITGSVDIFDRFTRRAIDWKTTTKTRIRSYQREGPPTPYVIQANIYAQGLIAQGEQVDLIALTFIPRDGVLSDVWTWANSPNKEIADKAITRYEDIQEQTRQAPNGPAGVRAVPSTLCGYCPNHRKDATDPSVACPGRNSNT